MSGKHTSTLLILTAAIALASVVTFAFRQAPLAHAQTAPPQGYAALTGWAWSETIGWISFDCANTGNCSRSNYGVAVGDDGSLSGYAWSDNVGWLSANASDLAGCPTAPCNASIQNGTLAGWFKALSGGSTQSGGWGGWVSLRGLLYGVSVLDNGIFSGFAWGSDVVGWTDLSLVHTTTKQCQQLYYCIGNDQYVGDTAPSCTSTLVQHCAVACSNGACIVPSSPPPPSGTFGVSPSLVRQGDTTQVSWTIENADACTISGNGNTWYDVPSGSKQSNPIVSQTMYTLHCSGPGGVLDKTATVNIIPTFQEK